MSRSRLRPTLFIAALIVSALVAAPSASAGSLVASANDCPTLDGSSPFTRWLDYSNYVPQSGGNFESDVSDWSLNGASIAAGNEPYNVGGADDSRSLSIPSGASATSSTMCVGLDHPTLRLFARSSGGSLLSSLRVDVRFEDSLGYIHTVPVGSTGVGGWSPTAPMPVVANLLALLPGAQTPVQFRFTAQGSANWQIDDVYVDPRRQ